MVSYLVRKSIYYGKRLEVFLLLLHAVIAMNRALIKSYGYEQRGIGTPAADKHIKCGIACHASISMTSLK